MSELGLHLCNFCKLVSIILAWVRRYPGEEVNSPLFRSKYDLGWSKKGFNIKSSLDC